MSLTVEAIHELQKPKTVAEVQQSISNHKGSLNGCLVALPDNLGIHSLERHQKFRNNYRFSFETDSINDYGKYCDEFAVEGSKCFISAARMSATTIFDLGTRCEPLHQEHTAKLSLKQTAAYRAMLSIDGTCLSQKETADFIEDWAENLEIYSTSGESMTAHQASKRLREITVDQISNRESKVGDFGESRSDFEKIEAKNQESMPSHINFTCDPFRGLDHRRFILRLSLLTSTDKPHIVMRVVKLEAHQEDMAEEFKEIITTTFSNEDIKPLIGQ